LGFAFDKEMRCSWYGGLDLGLISFSSLSFLSLAFPLSLSSSCFVHLEEKEGKG
jgi:hypothetical protein